jgi:hypothetical protein
VKYYKISYTLDKNNERVYPKKTKGVVWTLTQDHFDEKLMIGATESKLEADGKSITELTEKQANSLIEEYKATHPQPELPAGMELPPRLPKEGK